MRVGTFKLWRSTIVSWSLFVAFSVISFLAYRGRTVRWLARPEEIPRIQRDATIWSVVAALFALVSVFFALRAGKHRERKHVV
jgi:amino acid transporter